MAKRYAVVAEYSKRAHEIVDLNDATEKIGDELEEGDWDFDGYVIAEVDEDGAIIEYLDIRTGSRNIEQIKMQLIELVTQA